MFKHNNQLVWTRDLRNHLVRQKTHAGLFIFLLTEKHPCNIKCLYINFYLMNNNFYFIINILVSKQYKEIFKNFLIPIKHQQLKCVDFCFLYNKKITQA